MIEGEHTERPKTLLYVLFLNTINCNWLRQIFGSLLIDRIALKLFLIIFQLPLKL